MDKNDYILSLRKEVTSLRAQGKYKETIEKAYILLEEGEKFKDYKSILIAYVNIIVSYYCIGDIEEAFQVLDKFKILCDEHGDDEDRLSHFNTSFLLYEFAKNYNKAKEMLDEAIKLSIKLKKYNILSNAYSNYSHIYIIEEDYKRALHFAKLGLEAAKLQEPYYEILEIRVKLNIARSQIGLKDFESAKSTIDEITKSSVLDSFIRERAQLHDLYGYFYKEQGLYKDAFEMFTKAKELVESYDDVYLLKQIQEERCSLCDILNDTSLGYKVQKEYIDLLQEINKRELDKTALKLEIKHKVIDITKKASTDYLTGLYNRSYLETTANKWLKEADEKGERIICIAFDVDNFKGINDSFGHNFGDKILIEIGKLCLKLIPSPNIACRYGGDEFVIILKNASLEEGKLKVKEISQEVKKLNIYKDGKCVNVTISIGMSDNLSTKAKRFNDLFHKADIKLYKAKKLGKDTYVFQI
ncbi:diguanylate cyclase (GGDEF) domain-containing protein [Caloramator quimbayensis]|uniref:Diguanylate cyclase (GGDEF) domain-containing protein n=1 Tax=Caloramator quimbayensis TaxID=1147123 RepID=A0A1T4WL01_9CLOT|nr:GGDEF domain-containing protein [Caloramator quimbayensis]SKA77984.1 diguanylate cyclase (GGDEF) domain-containing protein [Caloramator quimbayensis]